MHAVTFLSIVAAFFTSISADAPKPPLPTCVQAPTSPSITCTDNQHTMPDVVMLDTDVEQFASHSTYDNNDDNCSFQTWTARVATGPVVHFYGRVLSSVQYKLCRVELDTYTCRYNEA